MTHWAWLFLFLFLVAIGLCAWVAIQYGALADRMHEAQESLLAAHERADTMLDVGRAVLPYLPEKSVDSFYADGGWTQRHQQANQEMARNQAVHQFYVVFKPRQTLAESKSAYERAFGYSSAHGVARAEASPTGTYNPAGTIHGLGQIGSGPDYSLEQSPADPP